MTNLSQWFDLAEQKPWEVGVYEVETQRGTIGYSYWCGLRFNWVTQDKGGSKEYFDTGYTHGLGKVVIKWRGLSTNPEVKKVQNKRKTMYVVQALWASGLYKAEGSYKSHANAKKHLAWLESNKACDDAWIEKIRFRTPE